MEGMGVAEVGVPAGEGGEWPQEVVARERLLRLGAPALGDTELLVVLLGDGGRGHPAQALARELLAESGLRALLMMDPLALSGLPEVGPVRAAQALAALELCRRAQSAPELRPRLSTAEEIHRYLRPNLSLLRREVFHVLAFNARNVLMRDVRVAEGTAHDCPVDPREVFGAALSVRASAVVLAHNHPSGDPEPSEEDVALTLRLAEGGRVLGVRVLDHLVLGDRGYVSLFKRGLLPLRPPPQGWGASHLDELEEQVCAGRRWRKGVRG